MECVPLEFENGFLDKCMTKREKTIGKRQLKCEPSQTWNKYPEYFRSTETHSQFKTAFYELKLESYTSSTLNFAPNMF